MWKARLSGALFALPLLLMHGAAVGQQRGDPQAGAVFARKSCSECHVVANDLGPDRRAASFVTIANAPGMTETALDAFLQTSHRNMPNIRLEREEMRNVVSYILSLKRP